MRTSLYIGCALQGAPVDFLTQIDSLKALLRDHFTLIEFVGLSPTANAHQVYMTDIACAQRAEIMLALCDRPSTGLGMEIMERIRLGKPVVVAYRAGAAISRMVLGAVDAHEHVSSIVYQSERDIVTALLPYANDSSGRAPQSTPW